MPKENTTGVVVTHFDKLAGSYDQKASNRAKYLGAIDQILVGHITSLGIPQPHILDVGTGTGSRFANLKRRIPGAVAHGSDISPQMIEQAQGKGIDSLRVASVTDLPYEDGSFDYALSLFSVLAYLPSEEARLLGLTELNRVLRPGGFLAADLVNRWHTGEGITFRKSTRTIRKELQVARESGMEPGDVSYTVNMQGEQVPGFHHAFTKREADGLFRRSGFRPERFSVIGYDSGQEQTHIRRGNFLYIVRKPS